MRLSNNWFEERTEAIWRKRLLRRGRAPKRWAGGIRYLEIGVCEGRSMRWVLEHLPVTLAIGVDPWEAPRPSAAKAFSTYRSNAYHNLSRPILSGQVKLIEERSREFLSTYSGDPFDLIYIDGDHRAPQALADMVLSFDHLAKGGLMLVDDLQRCWHNGRPQVFFAVQAFELIYKGLAKREWIDGRQIAFRKL